MDDLLVVDEGLLVLDEELFSPSSEPIAVRKPPCSASVSFALFRNGRSRLRGDGDVGRSTSSRGTGDGDPRLGEFPIASSSKVNGTNSLSPFARVVFSEH